MIKSSEQNNQITKLLQQGLSLTEIAKKTNNTYDKVRYIHRRLKKDKNYKGIQRVEATIVEGKPSKGQTDKLLSFFLKGKNEFEMLEYFRMDKKAILNAFEKAYGKEWRLVQTVDIDNNPVWIAVPSNDEFAWKKNFGTRPFELISSPNTESPYFWVKFNKELSNHTKIKVVPISDLHYGSIEYDEKKFIEYIEWIKNTPNVVTYLNGDIVENSSKTSVADGVYRQFSSPLEQIRNFCKLVAPIQHKIMFSIRGNHEKRGQNTAGIDPGRYIADELEIPYYIEPVYVDLFYGENIFNLFAWHGAGSGVTKASKYNVASKPCGFTEFTHFYVSGHVHDKIVVDETRIVRDRKNFALEAKKQFVVVCPSFVRYFNSYASEMGLPPPSTGMIALEIFKNGDYHVSS